MRSTALSVAVLAAVVGFPLVSLASDMDKFGRRVQRSAVPPGDMTPPVVCVCKNGGQFHNMAGALTTEPQAQGDSFFMGVYCLVYGFSPATGTLNSAANCQTWELMPK
jgi:hypothetical protein